MLSLQSRMLAIFPLLCVLAARGQVSAVYSPDGTKILYMSDRLSPGSFDTFVMNADGSHKKRLIIGALLPNWGTKPTD